MKPNEFVGFTLPIVNEGPWSYFSNGIISEDGEDETMIVDGILDNGVISIDEKSKTIYDAIASGKTVIIKFVDELLGTIYSLIIKASLGANSYVFDFYYADDIKYVTGTADENPSYSDDSNDNT